MNVVCALSFGCFCLVQNSVGLAPREAFSDDSAIQDICRGNQEVDAATDDILVEVATSAHILVDEHVFRKWLPGKVALRNDVQQFAFKGPKRLLRTLSSSQTWLKAAHVRQDMDRPRVGIIPGNRSGETAFNGMDFRKYVRAEAARGDTSAVSGSIHPPDKPMQHQFQCMYLENWGVFKKDPTQPDIVNEQRRSFLLPATLSRHPYKVTTEVLDGVTCIRLDGKTGMENPETLEYYDTMWFDPSHGFLMIRRDLGKEPGHTGLRMINRNPREIKKGVWIPAFCEAQEFSPADAPEEVRGTPLYSTRMEVRTVDLGVEDPVFEIAIPSGAFVFDHLLAEKYHQTSPIVYRMPANRDDLDAVVELALNKRPNGATRVRILLIGVNVILVVGLAAFVIVRRMRARAK